MTNELDRILDEISDIIVYFEIDYELDTDSLLDDLKRGLEEFRAKESFDSLLKTLQSCLSKDVFEKFRLQINQLLIQHQDAEYVAPLVDYIKKIFEKQQVKVQDFQKLINYNPQINNLINGVLAKYGVEYIDFVNRVQKKDANYISPYWIDRTRGRNLSYFFKNIPENEAYPSTEIYSDIYARDKSHLGYVYQTHRYIRNKETFYLARGPKIRRDNNAVFVIDNVGLSLSRLPSISGSRSRDTADLVPSFLDEGHRIYAKYMDNDSGHYTIYKSQLISKQPEWVDLEEHDEFIVYLSISLLIFIKLILNNERIKINQTGIYLDSNNPEEQLFIGDVLLNLLEEKDEFLAKSKEKSDLKTILSSLTLPLIESLQETESNTNIGYYSELSKHLG